MKKFTLASIASLILSISPAYSGDGLGFIPEYDVRDIAYICNLPWGYAENNAIQQMAVVQANMLQGGMSERAMNHVMQYIHVDFGRLILTASDEFNMLICDTMMLWQDTINTGFTQRYLEYYNGGAGGYSYEYLFGVE
jgi:hypothetical protein